MGDQLTFCNLLYSSAGAPNLHCEQRRGQWYEDTIICRRSCDPRKEFPCAGLKEEWKNLRRGVNKQRLMVGVDTHRERDGMTKANEDIMYDYLH